MVKMKRKIGRALFVVMILSGLLGGCAQTTVQPQFAQATVGPVPRPNQVVVYPFAVNPAQVTQNQGLLQGAINNMEGVSTVANEESIGQDAANALADEMVKRINALGLPSWRVPRGAPAPVNSLVIDGHFIDVNEGNRLERTVIGLGLGQSTMDTEAQVYTPSSTGYQMVLEFKTHADSGEMPGAAITGPAGAAAAGGLTAGVVAANVAM